MSLVPELITGEGQIWTIRRAISGILKSESVNQVALATAGAVDPAPYDFRVFEESTNPIETWNSDDRANMDKRPIVNISFDSQSQNLSSSSIVNLQSYRSSFNVDCYAIGFVSPDGSGGHTGADSNAGREATRVADLVRRILFAGNHTYLGLRGTVQSRAINNSTSFIPAIGDKAVDRVRCVRMTLEVVHVEVNQQALGEPIEEIVLTSLNDNDEVLYSVQIGESP